MMHYSYKYVKALKQNQRVCIQLACSRIPRALLRKPIIGIYKPSSIMKNSHQYMKVTTQETLYHEDHGATLKHKCGKRIVALSLLSFSLIFLFGHFLFFMASPFFGRSLSPTCGGIIVSIILSPLGQCSNNDNHHTSIYLQLNITTRYLEQSMTLYECLWQCTRM